MQRLVYSTSTNYSVTVIVLSVATSSTFSHSLKRAIVMVVMTPPPLLKFFVVYFYSLFGLFLAFLALTIYKTQTLCTTA